MSNKIMIITGTRKGIGNYLAKYYLGRDIIVFGCSRGKQTIQHKNYHHYQLDVSDEKKVVNMVIDVKRKFKRIDILINNAGIACMSHFALIPTQTVNEVFNSNFLGTFLFAREVSKVMILQKSGRIVNVSSVAVPLTLDGESVYAASKSAVEEFTKVIAKELGSYGITVNCIGVAPLMTDLLKSIPEDKIKKIVDMMPIKKIAEYKDVSNAVNFFINEESENITAQVIYLGGVS